MVTLDNNFLDKYLTKINPIFICIYIYIKKTNTNSAKEIAEAFDILESDALKAINFFKEAEKDLILESNADSLAKPPVYSPKELEIYQNSYKEIRELFKFCEKSMGKFFDAKHLSTIYSFYDFYGLSFELITYLIEYCTSVGQNRINYIEAVAIDWAKNGIDTIEKAQTHTSLFKKDYREIMKALGISRNSAPVEEEFINKWIDVYNMPMNLILEACDKAVLSSPHKPTFNYIDGIITNWHENGVKTIDDVKKLEKDFKQTNTTKKPKSTTKKAKFENYTTQKKDFDKIFSDIEQLELEEFKKSLKGK